MTRKHLSSTRRAKIFLNLGGACYLCNGKIGLGEGWDIEHEIPLALGGADDESNWRLAHRKCHKGKTRNDQADIGKARRRERKHIGIRKAQCRPLPGTRASGIRKRMNGTVERW